MVSNNALHKNSSIDYSENFYGNYLVYVHKNTINNKIYIGLTKDIKQRWKPLSYEKCPYFHNAINKYGWHNFKHIIIISNISRELACEIEKYLIRKYNSNNPLYGYNLAEGGRGGVTHRGDKHPLSKKIYQYDLDGNYIKEWTNAQIASKVLKIPVSDIYLACKEHNGVKQAGKYMWKYEMYNKINKYVREGISKDSILQLDKNFNIIKKYKNISYIDSNIYNKEKITNCCKRRHQYSHKNFYWAYEKDFNEEFISYIKERICDRGNQKQLKKKVYQYDKDNNLLNIYQSAKEASICSGIKSGTIQAYCKRGIADFGRKSKYGFIWKYE